MTTSAIVLAGGRSSRFGSPKLQALIDGVPLLDLAVRAVAEVTHEVVIVGPAFGGAALTDLDSLPSRVRIEVVHDPVEAGGPLVGLRAGLAEVQGDLLVMVGGDMPRLEPAVLRAMLERLAAQSPQQDRTDGVLLGQPGGAQPLPVALRATEARAAVEAAINAGETSLRAALARLAMVELPADEWRRFDPAGRSLIDVDTPADLEAAR